MRRKIIRNFAQL